MGGRKMKILFTFFKKADKRMNLILIPKFIVDKWGRDFRLDVMDNDTIVLTPIKKESED